MNDRIISQYKNLKNRIKELEQEKASIEGQIKVYITNLKELGLSNILEAKSECDTLSQKMSQLEQSITKQLDDINNMLEGINVQDSKT